MSEFPENTPARPFQKKEPMQKRIIDGLGRTFGYTFNHGQITWRRYINHLVPYRKTYKVTGGENV